MKIDIKHFQEKLEETKQRLEKELGGLGRVTKTGEWIAMPEKEEDNFHADPNENADEVEEFQERVGTLSELEKEYNNVVSALKQIKKGVYGICFTCKKPIEVGRLEANPAAKTCIEHMNL